jgi:hypothetical protein
MNNEDMKILSWLVGCLHLVSIIFVFPFATKWDVCGKSFWGHSCCGSFFFCWIVFLILSAIIAALLYFSDEYENFLIFEGFVLGTFILSLICYSFWPGETTFFILSCFIIFLFLAAGFLCVIFEGALGGGGGGGGASTSKEESTFQEKTECKPLNAFPYSATITDGNQKWKGYGLSEKEAKESAKKEMQKSLRFLEKNTSNPFETHFFPSSENPYSHETIDNKTGKKQTGHGESQKEARNSSWNKTIKG